ncbi:MAG: hypothetical protein GQ540_03555 [Lutibacter sp.]|uniref:hypothetical protein n=1 Tax=Lutibacter sp. TaxID=1925666 RepID=UPI0019EA1BC3|nr:hypothetical protein [Lutibacter sp.]NOR27588.1 hypothetical protein [Lutibacter sp.]
MAGSITFSETTHTSVKKLSMTWVSDVALGTVNAIPSEKSYTGMIERAVFIPDSGGTQPTNLYDVTITDSDGIDVLIGNGANLVNTGAVQKDNVTDGLGAVVSTTLTLNITNAGNSNGGEVILYIR